MTTMTAEGLQAVQIERDKRAKALDNLLAIPFDADNPELLSALTSYMNDFESSTNKMYLYQAMNEGLKAWGGVWLINVVLPIPEFATSIVTACLYFGLAGYLLESFNLPNFYDELAEMKLLYNWCLKDGKEKYTNSDNSKNLAKPEIQRLVKMLAPLCSVDFMIAWTRETEKSQTQNQGWIASGISAVSSAASFFSSKPSKDLTEITNLKIAVETKGLDVGIAKGFEQAISYFTPRNPRFKDMVTEKLSETVDTARDYLPQILGGMKTKLQ